MSDVQKISAFDFIILTDQLAEKIDPEAWKAIEDGRDLLPHSLWSVRRDFAKKRAAEIMDWLSAALHIQSPTVRAQMADTKWEWRPVDERGPWEGQPCRQFVHIEGARSHSGLRWTRHYCGEAFIRPPGHEEEMLGYRREDILRLCERGDMDPETAKVTHWMPVTFPELNIHHQSEGQS